MAGLMLLAVLAVVAVSCCARFPALAPYAEPPLVALAYAGVAVALAVLVFRVRGAASPSRVRLAVLALAWFMVITFTGVVTNVRLRRNLNTAESVKRLKEQLPSGQQLVSIDGHTDALFAYLYGRPLIAPGRGLAAEMDADGTYFCFVRRGNNQPSLSFIWEEVGAVCLDRYHRQVPDAEVVVGRRLPAPPPISLRAARHTVASSPMATND